MMVSAEPRTTTRSAGHGQEEAAAAVWDGVETQMPTAALAVNPVVKGTQEVSKPLMVDVVSRTITISVELHQKEDVVAASAGVGTVKLIVV